MTGTKRHLISKRSGYTACGLAYGRTDPIYPVTNTTAQVTCGKCAHTLEMADAEVREQQTPRRQRRTSTS